MTVLVTGATGFIGPHVAHALRARELPVRALVRDPKRAARLAAWGVELVHGDVADVTSLRGALAGVDSVVHLVAIIKGSRADFERVMTQGTRDVVEAAREAGVRRFVLASALGVDERSKDAVPYFGAKWEMERAVKDSGLEYVIFRPLRSSPPLAKLIGFMLIGRIVIPGVLIAISWILLASPNIGLVNQMVLKLTGLRNIVNIYSFWGMVWVQALEMVPLIYLLLSASFQAMDPRLEEASTMTGAGNSNGTPPFSRKRSRRRCCSCS